MKKKTKRAPRDPKLTITVAPPSPESGTLFVTHRECTAVVQVKSTDSSEAIAATTAATINSEPIDLGARSALISALARELRESLDAGAWTPGVLRLMKQIEHAASLPENCAITRPESRR